jgi:hypothetical protein
VRDHEVVFAGLSVRRQFAEHDVDTEEAVVVGDVEALGLLLFLVLRG